jgi:hypothetical protein
MQTFNLALGLGLIFTTTLASLSLAGEQDAMGLIVVLGGPIFLVGFGLILSALPKYLALLRDPK